MIKGNDDETVLLIGVDIFVAVLDVFPTNGNDDDDDDDDAKKRKEDATLTAEEDANVALLMAVDCEARWPCPR